jgi:hypothetical protein
MKSLVLALLLAAACTPAIAQQFPYPAFGAELDEEDSWDDAVELQPEPNFFDKIELAGGMKIALDRTSIFDLSEKFGNAVQTYQHVGYTTTWLCYSHAGRRVWYIADLTYETTDEVNFGSIIDEPADPVTDKLFLCPDVPEAMLATQPSLPTVGATRAELEARFKLAIPPGTTRVGGMRDSATEANSDYDMRIVYYRLKDDVVDAVLIAEDYMPDEEEESE